jgi:ABC-type sugar transport system ATPase subunit
MPDQTSGGQKQRVAIARGIVQDTDLFIFDDPLAGLDFKLREQLVDDLKALQERMHITIMYSTSDSMEALSLADTIAVLHDGAIIESGRPEEVYLDPQHAGSMRLLGFPGANIFEASLEKRDGGVVVKTGLFELNRGGAGSTPEKALVGIRPESILWNRPEEGCVALEGKVLLCEDLGGEEIVYLGAGDKIITMMRFHFEDVPELPYGTTVTVFIRERDVICYDAGSLNRW